MYSFYWESRALEFKIKTFQCDELCMILERTSRRKKKAKRKKERNEDRENERRARKRKRKTKKKTEEKEIRNVLVRAR